MHGSGSSGTNVLCTGIACFLCWASIGPDISEIATAISIVLMLRLLQPYFWKCCFDLRLFKTVPQAARVSKRAAHSASYAQVYGVAPVSDVPIGIGTGAGPAHKGGEVERGHDPDESRDRLYRAPTETKMQSTARNGCATKGSGVFCGEEFEFFEGAGPIFAEKAGEGAVGEELSGGLAGGAIVGFIGGVTNALDFGVATRTRLLVAAVNGHAFAKGGHVFGEFTACFRAEALGPVSERGTGGFEEALDLRHGELLGQREGRKTGFEQNFVGIGIAD